MGFIFSMSTLKNYIKEQVKNLAFRSVADDESLLRTKVLDSIVAVDLAVALEEHYHIQIPFTDINEANFDSVNLITSYLESKGVKAGT